MGVVVSITLRSTNRSTRLSSRCLMVPRRSEGTPDRSKAKTMTISDFQSLRPFAPEMPLSLQAATISHPRCSAMPWRALAWFSTVCLSVDTRRYKAALLGLLKA